MPKNIDWFPEWAFQEDLNGITENAVFPGHLDKENYKPRTLVDETLEVIDPTPNIHSMFVQFNEKYFHNKLLPVQVKWSARMTRCAGVCTFHPRNRECIIALSAPLLKLRPRKDLVETLLHEMIHGYLFLTNNDRDRDGHGPEFCKHMYRINKTAGTNISIYHDFHDEVKLYQQHWWRCNGPCQKRAPFFGTVRRSMNRAPGPLDRWWNEHKYNCGGEFIKVREPEAAVKKNSKGKEPPKVPSNQNTLDGYIISPKNKNSSSNVVKPNSQVNNIHSWGTSGPSSSSKGSTKNSGDFTKLGTNTNNVYGFGTGGPGSLSTKTNTKAVGNNTPVGKNPATTVHFTGTIGGDGKGKSRLLDLYSSTPVKAQKSFDPDIKSTECPICGKKFPEDTINVHLDDCLLVIDRNNQMPPNKRSKITDTKNHGDAVVDNNFHNCPICNGKYSAETINNHLDSCLLNGDNAEAAALPKINSNRPENRSLTSNSSNKLHECFLCHDFFSESEINDHVDLCLLQHDETEVPTVDLSASSAVKSATSEIERDTNNIRCPTCNVKVRNADYIVHVENCLNQEIKKKEAEDNRVLILDDEFARPGGSRSDRNKYYMCLVCNEMIDKSIPLNEHLETCVVMTYGDQDDSQDPIIDEDIEEVPIESDEEKKYLCPICMKMIEASAMAGHVDDCIRSSD